MRGRQRKPILPHEENLNRATREKGKNDINGGGEGSKTKIGYHTYNIGRGNDGAKRAQRARDWRGKNTKGPSARQIAQPLPPQKKGGGGRQNEFSGEGEDVQKNLGGRGGRDGDGSVTREQENGAESRGNASDGRKSEKRGRPKITGSTQNKRRAMTRGGGMDKRKKAGGLGARGRGKPGTMGQHSHGGGKGKKPKQTRDKTNAGNTKIGEETTAGRGSKHGGRQRGKKPQRG
jgi:hypothetical protein